MSSKDSNDRRRDLRRRAEELLQDQLLDGAEQSRHDMRELVQELAVHQVELDLQNEELRDSQLELNASRDRYQQLFDSAPIGYFVLDARGVIAEANFSGARLVAVSRSHLAGKPMITFLPSAEHERFFELLRAVLSGGAEPAELRLRPRAGEERVVRFSAQAVAEGSSGTPRCICALEDVTDLRRNERTLRRALEQAEQANKAKSAFLANMSHEVRTPLNGVLGILQLLARSPLGERDAVLVQTAQDAGHGLLEILNDVLEFSRIEAGSITVEEQPFSLGKVFDTLEKIFRPQVESGGIGLRVEVSPDLPDALVGDAGLLRQILFNLVGNAVKFTPEGEIRIWAGPAKDCSGEGCCRLLFIIEDTGVGIHDHDLEHIFDEFRQAEQTYSRRFGGVGLGLAIVRRLVRRLGGSLAFESEPGKGTRVYLGLSFGRGEGASAQPCRLPGSPEGKGRLLVVEDDLVGARVLGSFLREWGYSFTVAYDGQEALDILEKESFDLVLMDIRMPVLNGVDATRRIRSSGKDWADVPVVAMTAFASGEEREMIMEAGMNAYVTKPLDMEEMGRVLRELVAAG